MLQLSYSKEVLQQRCIRKGALSSKDHHVLEAPRGGSHLASETAIGNPPVWIIREAASHVGNHG